MQGEWRSHLVVVMRVSPSLPRRSIDIEQVRLQLRPHLHGVGQALRHVLGPHQHSVLCGSLTTRSGGGGEMDKKEKEGEDEAAEDEKVGWLSE